MLLVESNILLNLQTVDGCCSFSIDYNSKFFLSLGLMGLDLCNIIRVLMSYWKIFPSWTYENIGEHLDHTSLRSFSLRLLNMNPVETPVIRYIEIRWACSAHDQIRI